MAPYVSFPVTEELLVTVADKLYHQPLHDFATTLIGLTAAEYSDIVKDAGEDPGEPSIRVLRAWNNRAPRTLTDLYRLLHDAERRGFVQAGILEDVAPRATRQLVTSCRCNRSRG